MSILQDRTEPGKVRAALFALVVHAAFFAFLYFGVSWREEQPQGIKVDIWSSLPEHSSVAKESPPPKAPEPPPPPKPKEITPEAKPTPSKAEIELKDKKKPAPEKAPEKPAVPEKKMPDKKPAEPKRDDAAAKAAEAAQAEQARQQAAQAAAMGKVIDEHKAKIIAKIRRNIVMPPDVPDNIKAEYDVTLLPGGTVLNARLARSSGNAAYDTAVERAILKSQPLPLPPDSALFSRFRELHLIFSPKD